MKVIHVIEVPEGDYCWNGHVTCEHFDNEGGHPSCGLGFWEPKDCAQGYRKAKECKNLQIAK